MDIADIKKEKLSLEHQIASMLSDFENKCNVSVNSIKYEQVTWFSDTGPIGTSPSCTIVVKL